MYTPPSFREEDPAVLHDLIRRNNFGILFSSGAQGLVGTHLPFSLDVAEDGSATLVSHMARANPQWRDLRPDAEVLVVFAGPHVYVSPSWYREKVTVPTWNYAAVHVYGVPRIVEDPSVLKAQVSRLVHDHESPQREPWDVAHAAPVMDNLLKAIVGFEIPVGRMEGKMKFNQNRSREDQEGVIQALEGEDDTMARATVEIMKKNLERDR